MNLTEQRIHTPWQQKALTKLLGLTYKIVYKKGSTNSAADSLSRRSQDDPSQVLSLSCATPTWLEEVAAGYNQDHRTMELLQQLATAPNSKPLYKLINGLIRYKGCIWVGEKPNLHNKIFAAFHSNPVGGHSGFPITYKRIHSLFGWVGMKNFIKGRVQSCLVCQQAKPERTPYPGLLSPLPVPKQAWDVISMDFISGLPLSDGFDCIMVIVDNFTKYGHFIPVKHPYNAQKIADLFLDNVYKLHSKPRVIISDRDPVFTSNFWHSLISRVGTELNMSTANHP